MFSGNLIDVGKFLLAILPSFSCSARIHFQGELNQLAQSERLAINVSNVANLFLLVVKLYASVESQSLAVIASTMDSLLDLVSGLILWLTSLAMRTPNLYHYPIGKKRMQPVVSLPAIHTPTNN